MVLELKNVSLVQGGQAILSGVNLQAAKGSCVAILGPNGSGKSTLMAILSGYIWPTGGSVIVDGEEYGKVDLGRMRRQMGLIEPSRMPKFNGRITTREIVATGLFGTIMLPLNKAIEARQWERVDDEISLFGLEKLARRQFQELSTGEQMRALLARAMVSQAKVLLLDEPTVGLDIGARAACIGILDNLIERIAAPTVIIVSHHLDELPRRVDKVVLMKNGRIFCQGDMEKMLTSEKLSRLFECDIEVMKNNGRFMASVNCGAW